MERDEFIDLVGADYVDEYEKAQLSQKDATKDATSDTISRQAAIGEVKKHYRAYDNDLLELITFDIERLPPAQQEERTEERTESHGVCLDAISRQAAIRWVKTECNPYGKPTLDFESGKRVMKHLEQMPPAQPELKWIHVSERLPEERDWYLGIFKEPDTGWINPTPFICDYLLGTKTKATTKEGWILKGHTDREEYIDYYFNLECVAWMPLPEPYKEGETT